MVNMSGPVSIIVPCYNDKAHIRTCLDSLLALDYPNDMLEIIIIDGISNDGTKDILDEYAGKHASIRIISNPRRITPIAMNLGIKAARNEYIMIASSHSTFSPNYLKILFEQMIRLDADIAGGMIKTITRSNSKIASAIQKVLTNKLGVGNATFRTGVDEPTLADTVPYGLYKKVYMLKAGLYNEKLVRNQDIELSKRIIRQGGRIFLIPDALCFYIARETVCALAKNNFGNGYWNLLTIYITKRFQSLSMRHFIPLLFVLSLIIPTLASILYFPSIFISILSLSIYLLLVFIVSFRINDHSTNIISLILCFITLHLSYGLGSLAGLLRIDKLFIPA